MPDGCKQLTSEKIIAAWREIADSCDPTEADEVAMKLLRDAAEHDARIEEALDYMRFVACQEGFSLEDIGYAFCLERTLWRSGIESVLQARVLQQILRWSALASADCDSFGCPVVRHTFYARMDYATPSLRKNRDVNFIVIPSAYQELLMLSASATKQMLRSAGIVEFWSCLGDLPSQHIVEREVPQAFRRLVARIITSEAFDTLSTEQSPLSSLSDAGEWFSHVDEIEETSAPEATLIYSAQDYALSHELGHCLCPSEGLPYLESEQVADIAGLRLFTASWGWRDEILEECPLGQGARILLGPLFFFFSAALLFECRQALADRIKRTFEIDTGFLTDARDSTHLNHLSLRWRSARLHLISYTDEVKRQSGPFRDSDERGINNFLSTLNILSSAVSSWIAAIPDASLSDAVRLVCPGVLR